MKVFIISCNHQRMNSLSQINPLCEAVGIPTYNIVQFGTGS